jgi:hypothetical protein
MREEHSLIEGDTLWELFQTLVETYLNPNQVSVCGLRRTSDINDNKVLVIELCYSAAELKPLDPQLDMELTYQSREKLSEIGERAFPVFKHNLPDEIVMGNNG